jgi:hypothetical protein
MVERDEGIGAAQDDKKIERRKKFTSKDLKTHWRQRPPVSFVFLGQDAERV